MTPFRNDYAGAIAILDWDHRLPSQVMALRVYAFYTDEALAAGEEAFDDRLEEIGQRDRFPEFDVPDFEQLAADEAYEIEVSPENEIGRCRLTSAWRREVVEADADRAVTLTRESEQFHEVRDANPDRLAKPWRPRSSVVDPTVRIAATDLDLGRLVPAPIRRTRRQRPKFSRRPRHRQSCRRSRLLRPRWLSLPNGEAVWGVSLGRMATERSFDAVVIGSGPGGYVCGIRLGHLGVKTAVIEKGEAGGVCLNVGCIPSKALIHAAKTFEKLGHADDLGIQVPGAPTIDMAKLQRWKGGVVKKLTGGVKQLLKGNGTEFISGRAVLAGKDASGGHRITVETNGKSETIIAKNVVVATGSRPIVIPGFDIDGKRVIDSTGALALTELPERMVVIGGGYIGLELGTVYAKFGTKVTVVEAMPSLLSGMDKDCVKVVARKLKKMGVEVLLNTKAKRWEDSSSSASLTVETKDGEKTIETDKILLSIGRRPNSEGLGLDVAGVATDKRGFITINDQLRTNVAGIYAIGDVAGGMLLAHKASKEAETVAEVIAGHKAGMDLRTMPAVVFTDPEIASTGMTEDEAREAGHEIAVGKFPFAALGRALSVNDTDGFTKIITDKKTEEILGMHIVGNGAADLISEGALAIEMGAVSRDIALTVHPHPTLSESLMESAAASLGEAVHIINR